MRSPTAFVLRENLVRFEHVPIVTRVPDLPPLAGGMRVLLSIGSIDQFALTFECRFASAVSESDGNAPPADVANDGDNADDEELASPVPVAQ